MTDFQFKSAVRSNVGLVRKNNQDSGYAGPHFLLIADGMGGHAGGDVASAITVARLRDLDNLDFHGDSLDSLRARILDANGRITNAVKEQPDLGGMGTTVTALLKSHDRLALAHIGDSRAYLLRDDSFTQMTTDHTFVQMLVDEGRITPEEAEYHPQRSVVMRVLGDVGASPELDMSVREARVGDRWMLCSDGLTGFADLDAIEQTLRSVDDPGECAETLVNMALEGGGADNITVVIGDVVEAPDASASSPGEPVGESAGSVAINPHYALLGGPDDSDTQPVENLDTEVLPHVPGEAPDPSVGTSGENVAGVTAGAALHGKATPGAEVPATSGATGTGGEPNTGDSDARSTDADLDPSGSRNTSATDPEQINTEQIDTDAVSTGVTGAREPDDPAVTQRGEKGKGRAATGRNRARSTREGRGSASSTTKSQDSSRTHTELSDADANDFDEFEDEEPKRSWTSLIVVGVVAVVLIATAALGWAFIRQQYYVTAQDGKVAVYQGISQSLGPISLSSLSETTDIVVADLPSFTQSRLEETIPASDKEEADRIVERLRTAARQTQEGDLRGDATDGNGGDPAPSAPGSETPNPDSTGGTP